jgi:hypothetical protein
MRKKAIAWCFVPVVLFLAALAGAEVNVNINIGTPPPAVVLSAPPALAVVPGTYVYVAAELGGNANTNLVFYQDNWYRPHGGGWYAAVSYNGPWKAVAQPPAAVLGLPQNYLSISAGQSHMPYVQVKDNWRTWERDRHWDAKRGDDHDHGHDKHHKKEKKKHHDDGDDHDHDRGEGHDRGKHKNDD